MLDIQLAKQRWIELGNSDWRNKEILDTNEATFNWYKYLNNWCHHIQYSAT